MCGIVGYLHSEVAVNRDSFQEMRDSLSHRGPDDAHSIFANDDRVALGHRRLSFLDLGEDGRQPMAGADGSLWCVFNGEIYNYLELRAELQKLGCAFRTHTDTEVLLWGYKVWGREMLTRLRGMFAVAIWEPDKQELFLARDRFGMKPLYYWLQEGRSFVFASELRAILKCPGMHRQIDFSALGDYLTYRYVPPPKSIWKGVKKLLPGHSMLLNLRDFSADLHKYWEPSYAEEALSGEEFCGRFQELLKSSIDEHLRSDVPLGAFLSGGYDSSLLACLMKEQGYEFSSYSLGVQDWSESEHHFAQVVADKIGVELKTDVAPSKMLGLLPEVVGMFDEPNADSSIVPESLVSRLASSEVKAVISGEGADELFAGYPWSRGYDQVHNMRGPAKWARQVLGRLLKEPLPFYSRAMARGAFDAAELKLALSERVVRNVEADPHWFYRLHIKPELPPLKIIQHLDTVCFMGELVLNKVDRASMAYSLEVRLPFLDHRLFDFVFSCSPDSYFRAREYKYPIAQYLRPRFPARIVERAKQGFVGPDSSYLDIEFYRKHLSSSRLVEAEVFKPKYVQKLLASEDLWRLWKLAVLEFWWRRWVA